MLLVALSVSRLWPLGEAVAAPTKAPCVSSQIEEKLKFDVHLETTKKSETQEVTPMKKKNIRKNTIKKLVDKAGNAMLKKTPRRIGKAITTAAILGSLVAPPAKA